VADDFHLDALQEQIARLVKEGVNGGNNPVVMNGEKQPFACHGDGTPCGLEVMMGS